MDQEDHKRVQSTLVVGFLLAVVFVAALLHTVVVPYGAIGINLLDDDDKYYESGIHLSSFHGFKVYSVSKRPHHIVLGIDDSENGSIGSGDYVDDKNTNVIGSRAHVNYPIAVTDKHGMPVKIYLAMQYKVKPELAASLIKRHGPDFAKDYLVPLVKLSTLEAFRNADGKKLSGDYESLSNLIRMSLPDDLEKNGIVIQRVLVYKTRVFTDSLLQHEFMLEQRNRPEFEALREMRREVHGW